MRTNHCHCGEEERSATVSHDDVKTVHTPCRAFIDRCSSSPDRTMPTSVASAATMPFSTSLTSSNPLVFRRNTPVSPLREAGRTSESAIVVFYRSRGYRVWRVAVR